MTFSNAINSALHESMRLDDNVICYGLGVPDPKGVFGTTLGLQEVFGRDRVFDMPTSENAMTGIAIGASLAGIRTVMTHQRLDFFLLALDQLINNAAKWRFMFGGNGCVPITIRLIIGRGWGQGPTHSQNLQAIFSHIPGLKVVMPSTPSDAKGLLMSSIFDDDPVVYLEHRWLHNQEGDVPMGDYRVPIGKANYLREGKDLSVVAMSYMTVEAIHAIDLLSYNGITCDLIDLRTVKPLDWEAIFRSVRKTGRLLALDTGVRTCSVSSEIVARVSMECHQDLLCAPDRVALPDSPTPTSFSLTKVYYKGALDIINAVSKMLNKNISGADLVSRSGTPHDVPGDWFKGPF